MFAIVGSLLPAAASAVTRIGSEAYGSAYAASADGGYYYDHLTIGNQVYELGRKFYAVLEDMRVSGDFKDGKISRSIDDIVTSDQLKAWVEDGDLTVPKAFGAARDSFLMDHPELFYIDVYKIMISAGRSGGRYTGYIDSGREADIYRDGAFKTEAEVNTAIAAYNAAVKEFADDAKAGVSQISTIYKDDAKLAIAVNNAIAKRVKYDFSAYNDYMENGEDAESVSSLAHTAYGALVNRKAVCSGYSLGYKAVMDSLGVPTVVVSGYSIGKDTSGDSTSGSVPHSWNYVRLETAAKSDASVAHASADSAEKVYEWFAFDTTWNSMSGDKNKYSAMYSNTASDEHMPDTIISSSNYPLAYPSLCSVPYEQAVSPNSLNLDIEEEGFKCSKVCTPSGTSYEIRDYVSYNGKNSGELAASENLRMIQRMYYIDGSGNKSWTKWQDLANTAAYAAQGHTELGIEDMSGATRTTITYNVQNVQYAVISGLQPDKEAGWGLEYLFYNDNAAVESHAVYMSDEIANPVYGTYTPPPYIVYSRSKPISGMDVTISSSMSEPGDSNMMADKHALTIKLVYDEPLHILDAEKDIEVVVTARVESALQYSALVAYPDGKYVHLTEDENGVLNTVEFKFKPSLMFEHNRVGYTFAIKNVGSAKIVEKRTEGGEFATATSDMIPNSAYYVFSRAIYACPKVFGDGRLYIDCCAQPTLVDNSDLSATGFNDENGNSTFSESARSQMMLVVNDVSTDTQNAIIDGIDAGNNGIGKDDILKSQTYDINLQMCGKIATIPPGSYVRLGLGFPEGYGPDDEGVTFKIFHRKHKGGDVYEIEEIPCVVTKFGIVVTVNSFSPYTVVAVPESKATGKTITASIDGKGGTLSKDDGLVRSVEEGGSYTYTLTPDSGYQLYRVLLNGDDVTSKVAEGKLRLDYAELSTNNEIVIKYISDDAKVRYEANGIVDPVRIIIPIGTDLFGTAPITDPGQSGANVGLIVGLVLTGVVIVAAAATATAIILAKKKKAAVADGPDTNVNSKIKEDRTANKTSAKSTTRTSAKSTAATGPKSTGGKTAKTETESKPKSATRASAKPVATERSKAKSEAKPTAKSAAKPTANPETKSTSKKADGGATKKATATKTAAKSKETAVNTSVKKSTATNKSKDKK